MADPNPFGQYADSNSAGLGGISGQFGLDPGSILSLLLPLFTPDPKTGKVSTDAQKNAIFSSPETSWITGPMEQGGQNYIQFNPTMKGEDAFRLIGQNGKVINTRDIAFPQNAMSNNYQSGGQAGTPSQRYQSGNAGDLWHSFLDQSKQALDLSKQLLPFLKGLNN